MKKLLITTLMIMVGSGLISCKKKSDSKSGNGDRTVVKYIEPGTNNFDDPQTLPTDGGQSDPLVFYIDLAANESFTTPDIPTDNILDVVFVPSYNATGNIHAYTQLGVKICVGGRCDVARPARIGQPSQVFNFKDRVSNGKAKIKISDPVYDFYCLQYRLACPFKSMYDPQSQTNFSRVRWAGRIIVGTNDTRRVEDALYNQYDQYSQGGYYQGW